ncbi:class I SAM-dependent methyltransferase [Candidatus Pelagibacter sp.]|nr:class I SAM-dependent methyltransferase [Candidatus Pelagibacter sp.]
MNKIPKDKSIEQKNIDFFSNNLDYQNDVNKIDTYQILFNEITNKISGSYRLLDIGHGGSFDYDTNKAKEIIGLDLDQMIGEKLLPKNIQLKVGSALDIPNDLKNFDTTLLVMLIHHLIGKNVNENLKNLDKCLHESKKTLVDNGKLVIVESCVPHWFYLIEKLLFKLSSIFINKFLKHPPAFQFTKDIIVKSLKKNNYKKISFNKIKQGKYILQYGFKVPTFLTPVETVIITAYK